MPTQLRIRAQSLDNERANWISAGVRGALSADKAAPRCTTPRRYPTSGEGEGPWKNDYIEMLMRDGDTAINNLVDLAQERTKERKAEGENSAGVTAV